MEFQELFAVDAKTTLRYFYQNLREMEAAESRSDDEALYVSSVLASYARTSREDRETMPPLPNLASYFDLFVLKPAPCSAPGLLQQACGQVLFLNGFLRDQMSRRHNVRYFDEVAVRYYARASVEAAGPRQRALFNRMSVHFSTWAIACRDLHRTLRDNRFLLRLE